MGAPDPKQVQREFYEAGEYHALSRVLEPAAHELVDIAGVAAGEAVLDVGAGDGNVAIAAARRGARVVATDLAPLQTQRGAERTAREGLAVEWAVADVEALPYGDDSFDHVLSAFAAVIAPDADRAAAELFRVCKGGGTIAVTLWPPGSFMDELTAAVRRASPPEMVFPDPEVDWADEEVARRRLSPFAEEISFVRRTLQYDVETRGAAGQDDYAAAYFRKHLPTDAAPAIMAAREHVLRRFPPVDGVIDADYLIIVARKRRT